MTSPKSSVKIELFSIGDGMTREELLLLINQASNEGWKELDLSGKGLTELPPEIGKLTQLETLILGTWAKEKKGYRGIKGYEVIEHRLVPLIVGNRLQSLPPELANLVNLRKLDISGNPWEKIPDVITQLRHLEQLTLICLELNEFPESISQLVNLTQLDLSYNKLTQVSESISQLVNLTQLNLSDNVAFYHVIGERSVKRSYSEEQLTGFANIILYRYCFLGGYYLRLSLS